MCNTIHLQQSLMHIQSYILEGKFHQGCPFVAEACASLSVPAAPPGCRREERPSPGSEKVENMYFLNLI